MEANPPYKNNQDIIIYVSNKKKILSKSGGFTGIQHPLPKFRGVTLPWWIVMFARTSRLTCNLPIVTCW